VGLVRTFPGGIGLTEQEIRAAAYAIFSTETPLEDVFTSLNSAGFESEDICVFLSPTHPIADGVRNLNSGDSRSGAEVGVENTVSWLSTFGGVVIPGVGCFVGSREYLRALAQVYRYTDEGFAEAVVLARQALVDPSYAPAAALVGWCRGQQRAHGWGALSDEDIGEACRLARQALEAERDDAETIWQAAWTLFFLAGEVAMAAAALDRALALNPNAAHAWLIRGHIYALRNQPEAAIQALERARRLSPFDPYTFLYATTIGVAHFAARRFEQAIEWAGRALARPAAQCLSDADQSRRQCPSRTSRRGTRRTQSTACHRPQGDHRRLSRVRSLSGTGSSRTLGHRLSPGWPTGGVSRR